MADYTDREIILSAKEVDVKFKVRGRVLNAIRGISLDLYKGDCYGNR